MNKILYNNTLFILDWDDTLFPTKWFITNKMFFTITPEFIELDKILYKLFYKLFSLGTVIIVTNAYSSWLKASSVLFPNSSEFILKTKIISTRGKFKSQSLINIFNWKKIIFKEESKKYHNIISIGDAEFEYYALININNNKLLKSIRFIQNPSIKILIDELNTLLINIPNITKNPHKLDLLFIPN